MQRGFQVFAVSWRNPTEEHRDWGLDTYVDAVHEALQAAAEIAGSEKVNTVSLCAGGITIAALLGHLASTQEALINCATFGVTLLDFTVPTMIGLLASPAIIENSVRATKRGGVLHGRVREGALLALATQRPHLELLGPQQPDGRGAADLRCTRLEFRCDAASRCAACRLSRPVHAELVGRRRALGPRDSRRPEQGRVRLVRGGGAQRPSHGVESLLRHDPAHGRDEPVRPLVIGTYPEPRQSPRQPENDRWPRPRPPTPTRTSG